MKMIFLLALMLAGPAFATGDDYDCRGNCGGDSDGPPIEIDIDADGGDATGGEGGDGGYGEGGDATGGDASNAGQSVNVITDNRRAPGSFVTHGDSTASDQKVRSISGGWLTGSMGLRWDATDKELRALRRADAMRARGQISAADRLECGQKVIYKSIGGNPHECWTLLAASNTNVDRTSYDRRDLEQDQLILSLQMQLAELSRKNVPDIEEEQAVVRMEVAQVAQSVEEQGTAQDELKQLADQYQRDRANDQTRRQESAMYAQDMLRGLSEKGYTPAVNKDETE